MAYNIRYGVIKKVLSGDTVVLRAVPKGGPPPRKILTCMGVSAPKLQRFIEGKDETEDEPFAWEAREFLRKRLIGKHVCFTIEKMATSINVNALPREYGTIYLGNDPSKDENISESLVTEGLAKVRSDNKVLIDMQEKAKALGKGLWGPDKEKHDRNIVRSVDNQVIFKKFKGKSVPAIIEHVRDGSTVRAFLIPPDENTLYDVTVMLTGIRAPGLNSYLKHAVAVEAQFFVESLVLQQQEVEILIEYADTTSIRGTVLRNKKNIAESILLQGFAQCIDVTMRYLTSGATTLRAAERKAKEEKMRFWANWVSTAPVIPQEDKEYQATVMEVVNGDAFKVKQANGTIKKIFLSSIRAPREKVVNDEDGNSIRRVRANNRPLYDIPWMFEAREFSRKNLIGKKVSVSVDFILPARNNLLERNCCTVTIGGVNIGEALVAKGYATVVIHHQNDDQRSSQYDKLIEAEQEAKKEHLGLHAETDIPVHKVIDVNLDHGKDIQFLTFLRNAQYKEALVEFVNSGSRMRLFIPEESWLIKFSLRGIDNCPLPSLLPMGSTSAQKGEPHGDEALLFTKERCLQREVQIRVDYMDKLGHFFGWLYIDGLNMSLALVEAGFASVHVSAERSVHYRALKAAEDAAKKEKIGIWEDFVEDEVFERKINYEKVIVTEVTPEGQFFAQSTEQGPTLESLMAQLRQEFSTNPPLVGEYTPRKGDICMARFTADDQWYRAKIEKIQSGHVSVLYIDFGNRETLNASRCARLPDSYKEKAYATEYTLACVTFPLDEEYKEDAVKTLKEDILNKVLLMNVEDRTGVPAVTLTNPTTNKDIAQGLIFDGLLMVQPRREKRFAKLLSEYKEVQDGAKMSHVKIWRYGDITEDDAKEFGIGR